MSLCAYYGTYMEEAFGYDVDEGLLDCFVQEPLTIAVRTIESRVHKRRDVVKRCRKRLTELDAVRRSKA
jgi:hypothetical protein